MSLNLCVHLVVKLMLLKHVLLKDAMQQLRQLGAMADATRIILFLI